MNVIETVRIGLQGIAANKLRSGLTMLGILIGVASVIVLMAIGNGASVAVTASIESLGTNTLTVRHGTFSGDRDSTRTQFKDLTVDDAVALVDPILAVNALLLVDPQDARPFAIDPHVVALPFGALP